MQRRNTGGVRSGSQPPESNRADYLMNLEDVVQKRRSDVMKTQGMELVRLLRVSTILLAVYRSTFL